MKIDLDDVGAIRPDLEPLHPVRSAETLNAILRTERDNRRAVLRPPRRPWAAAGVALVLTLGTGTAVAAAGSGWVGAPFAEVFSPWLSWPDGTGADPTAAVRRASAPGPVGTVFSVLTTEDDGGGCRTAVFESEASATASEPTEFTPAYGDWCADGPSGSDFGTVGVDSGPMADGFVVSAGEAVRAEVTAPDGRTFPALLVGGDFWGWFPTGSHPTLVAYAVDGAVVGTIRL
ncbi:hypothetical protein GCM10022215_34260 [Nocardioides fonticola]|uniref:Uncharacterized protein n=1 Tax=Nocardioides fonticola TaxID=450363 RepID=A0ABP7XTZ0_9ACTN